jgi:SNF family Na+-dependent transporter
MYRYKRATFYRRVDFIVTATGSAKGIVNIWRIFSAAGGVNAHIW